MLGGNRLFYSLRSPPPEINAHNRHFVAGLLGFLSLNLPFDILDLSQ